MPKKRKKQQKIVNEKYEKEEKWKKEENRKKISELQKRTFIQTNINIQIQPTSKDDNNPN